MKLLWTLVSNRAKWRGGSLVLSAISLLINLVWVSLPFSFYGLRGRSGIIYGIYTLFTTFSIHPVGLLWWTLIVFQVFASVLVVGNVLNVGPILRFGTQGLPGILQLLLDVYVAGRWATMELWAMYAIGAFPGLLLLASGACYAKAEDHKRKG